jgi:RNA polymerase sigma-70 factor (ECF subfamily)
VSENPAQDFSPAPSSDVSGPSDHDLIRRAQRGEERAFEELVRRHEERAMRVALALIANREDARDLAQEAFLRVFRNLDRFDFEHEFTTWLYRIVTNLAIDLLRKRRPAMSTSAEEEEEADLDLADPEGPAPSHAMEQMETAERVRACIDRLAPHFRSVMILRELEGLPCTEIARIVGATHVTVRWRLHRGRKLFLEEWERMQGDVEKSGAPRNDDTNTPPEDP